MQASISPPSWKQTVISSKVPNIALTVQGGAVSIHCGWNISLSDETMQEYLAKVGSRHAPGFIFDVERALFSHGPGSLYLTPEQAAEIIGFLAAHYGIAVDQIPMPAEQPLRDAFSQGAAAYGRCP